MQAGRPFDWREIRAQLINAERTSTDDPSVPRPLEAQPTAPPSTPSLSTSPGSPWWVHELAVPERGCVLLAQPHAIFPEQPLLRRAAVLVLEHSDAEGTVGLLLNRPANRTVGDLLKRRDDLNLRPFRSRPLYIGGDVLPASRGLRVLTRRCDVPSSNEVLFGLWECTPAAAARMVSIGAAQAAEFDFFAAACQWSPHKLREELDAAIWLPAAASHTALLESASGVAHELYFDLIEGVGGEYARQARVTRSQAEVLAWLQRSASRAAAVWRQLAPFLARERHFRIHAESGDLVGSPGLSLSSLSPGGAKGGGSGGLAERGGVFAYEDVALCVHRALYERDNLTDIWLSLDSLAEQASYIWFTRELDAQLRPGTVETPPKDPGFFASSPRHGDATSARAPSMRARAGQKGGKGGGGGNVGSGGGCGGGGSGARPPAAARAGGAPPLRVVPAAHQQIYSIENGLLSLNLLLFEICRYSPRERGDGTAEHSSLAHIVRRSGGPASILMLCVLYAALARRLGVALQLVELSLPDVLRSPRSPRYLLRLPSQRQGKDEQEELYIDVLAEGRLRGRHDLPSYASVAMPQSQLQEELVRELRPSEAILLLLEELMDASEAADNFEEAVFWQMQSEVLEAQIRLAADEQRAEADEDGPGAE